MAAWTYNQAGVTYNHAGVLYNDDGGALGAAEPPGPGRRLAVGDATRGLTVERGRRLRTGSNRRGLSIE